jgi:hypothetical protein
LLRFKGKPYTLVRKGTRIAKPGGGTDYSPDITLPAQDFALVQVGEEDASDGENGDTPTVKRQYLLTGRYSADVRVNDTFSDAEANYRVEKVNANSGFKVVANVVGFVKVAT